MAYLIDLPLFHSYSRIINSLLEMKFFVARVKKKKMKKIKKKESDINSSMYDFTLLDYLVNALID